MGGHKNSPSSAGTAVQLSVMVSSNTRHLSGIGGGGGGGQWPQSLYSNEACGL
jgi:hypothetical protein